MVLVSEEDDHRWTTRSRGGRPRRRGAHLLKILAKSCSSHALFFSSSTHLRGRDPSGALNFNGKAVLHAKGVDFSNGASFAINMTQLQLEEELGRGNYGTVKKVLHKPTKVYMAMKVCPSCSHVVPADRCTGNPLRA